MRRIISGDFFQPNHDVEAAVALEDLASGCSTDTGGHGLTDIGGAQSILGCGRVIDLDRERRQSRDLLHTHVRSPRDAA